MKDLCMIIWVITLINFLSKFQCGFQKVFGAQNCLLCMIETIWKTRDNHRVFAAVMTNSSKVFDYISHELSIAKINVYGYDEASLKVIISFLKNRTQTTKEGSVFSEFLNIIYMVFHKDQSQLVCLVQFCKHSVLLISFEILNW